MLIFETSSTFYQNIAPMIGYIISIAFVIIGFLLVSLSTIFSKSLTTKLETFSNQFTEQILKMSKTLDSILTKLDQYFTDLSLVKTDQKLLEEKLNNLDIQLDRCQESNCRKIFEVRELVKELEKSHNILDKAVQEDHSQLERIKYNHNRNHPEDKF
jgi:uncharacterized protein (DUF927 family)